MLTLQQYLNEFTRLEHTAELRRLLREAGITRQFCHAIASGRSPASLPVALRIYKATHGRVDPRTLATTFDWGMLDAYYRQEQGVEPPPTIPKAELRASRTFSKGALSKAGKTLARMTATTRSKAVK